MPHCWYVLRSESKARTGETTALKTKARVARASHLFAQMLSTISRGAELDLRDTLGYPLTLSSV